MYYANNDFRFYDQNYLMHHGIKGQKWGVKNGPPYPLGAGDHSKREQKAGWRSSLSSKINKKAAGGSGDLQYSKHDTSTDRKVKDDYNRMSDKEFKDKYRVNKKTYAKRAEKADRKGYSVYKNAKERSDKLKNSPLYKPLEKMSKPMQKLLTKMYSKKSGSVADFVADNPEVTAAVAQIAAALTLRGVIALAQNISTDIRFADHKDTSDAKKVTDLPKSKTKLEASDSVKKTNPGFPKSGRTMNCVLCTTAMAMREKGYNVEARESADGWDAKRVMRKMFGNKVEHKNFSGLTTHRSMVKVENQIKQYGDGSYGQICVYWPMGGGHSMFWKNEGGKVKVYDGQSGKTYSLKDFENKIVPGIQLDRLDNVEPTDNVTAFVSPMKGGK